MTFRATAALTTLAAAGALAVAYGAQYLLDLTPCELCLWERWPYRAIILLGLVAVLIPRRVTLVLPLAPLLAAIAVAGLHVGVEFGWWPSPLPECNGILTPGAPLPLTPATPCDRPVYLIPHLPLSMAAMDLLYATAFATLLAAHLWRRQRRFT